MSEGITLKRSHLLILVAILVIGAFGAISVFATGGSGTKITGNTAKVVDNGEYQTVKLTFENYEYILEPSELVKDVPVRMEVDLDSVYGCMRDIVIGAFGVREYVSSGNNIIEFTPDKAGTFNIACSMNMGRGKFTVVESDGSTSDFVESEPIAEAGSCGAGAGGCGCGGRAL